jgi:hypothetical protein
MFREKIRGNKMKGERNGWGKKDREKNNEGWEVEERWEKGIRRAG